jgi:hypothetical protein
MAPTWFRDQRFSGSNTRIESAGPSAVLRVANANIFYI